MSPEEAIEAVLQLAVKAHTENDQRWPTVKVVESVKFDTVEEAITCVNLCQDRGMRVWVRELMVEISLNIPPTASDAIACEQARLSRTGLSFLDPVFDSLGACRSRMSKAPTL